MMKTSKGFVPKDGIYPFEGLDSVTPTTQMTPGSSPNVINLTTFRGTLQKRTGYAQLGTTLVNEPVIKVYNFTRPDGTNILIVWTLTKMYSWDGASWTDRTPAHMVQKFTGLSGGNGWSVTSGSIVDGGFVQQTNIGVVAIGQIIKISTSWFIVPVYGYFSATQPITMVLTSGTGTLALTGSDPNATTDTVIHFPLLSAGNGWSITLGAFTQGDTVAQAGGGTGIFYGNVSDFTILYTGGSWNSTDAVMNTSSGRTGTISLTGTSAFTTTTAKFPATQSIAAQILFPRTEDYVSDVVEITDTHLGRIIVSTDGLNPPLYWDGLASTFNVLPMNLAGFCRARRAGVLNSYLIFADVTTNLDRELRTAVWCDTGNVQEWNEGNSGVLVEMNFQGEILRLIPFSDKMIVFSQGSIGCICYIDPNVIFGSQIYVTGTRIISGQAICNINPFLIYAGQDNVYIWDGGSTVSPIGDRISNIYKSLQDKNSLSRASMFFDIPNSQVRFNVPTSASTSITLILEIGINSATFYDSQKSSKARWFIHEYNDRPVSYGFYPIAVLSNQNYVNTVIGSDGGKVFLQQTEINDGGVAIPVTYDTLDFTAPEIYQSQFARWLEFEYEASGSTIGISYSIDRGASWILLETDTLTSTPSQYRVCLDVTSRAIRFRFSSSSISSSFTLSWFRAWFRSGGAR